MMTRISLKLRDEADEAEVRGDASTPGDTGDRDEVQPPSVRAARIRMKARIVWAS